MKILIWMFLVFLAIGTTDSFANLKLTCPKGGEKFVAGSDTLITWEGILPTDTVKLEYSIDKGVNWHLITDEATGLKYTWKNVPKPTSNECLIRIKPFGKVDSSNFEPAIEWQRTFGGSEEEYALSVQQTSDSGFIIVGTTHSNDGDIISKKGSSDIWILKIDAIGNKEWQKTYGNNMSDGAVYIILDSDGGYTVACNTEVDGGSEIWILKLDFSGNLKWDLKYSHQNYANNKIFSIKQTSDSGYIASGWTGKYSKAIEGLILKLDKNGNVKWEKTFNKDKEPFCCLSDINETSDSAYVAVGATSMQALGYADVLIIKVTKYGEFVWMESYDNPDGYNELASSFTPSINGGFVVGCTTMPLMGPNDFLVMKLDDFGIVEWTKIIGGSKEDFLWSLQQSKRGGYLVAGQSNSDNGDICNNFGLYDGLIVKLTDLGEIKWEKSIGGNSNDYLYSIKQLNDGGIICVGSTYSTDIPGCIIKGKSDFYVVKIGTEIITDQSDSTFSINSPQAQVYDIDMKKQLVGTPKDSLISNYIFNIGICKVRVDSIYFRGTDAGAFSIITGLPKYSLEPSKGKNTRFGFTPIKLGIHNAEIIIITQSDTLIRNIQGEGILHQIQALNDVIDFGKVILGKNKDTLQAVTIKNTGSAAIKITKTKHSKPNDYDFTTLAGGGSFVLNSGDTAKLDLRFKPSAIGNTNGTLEFYYEGIGSPAKINLYGEGVSKNSLLQAPTEIDFNLICSNSLTNYVPIYNNGGDTLRISEINVTGIDANEFSVNEVFPIKIPPIRNRNIAIEFKPNSLGTKFADLEIKSNSDPNTNITIPINAKRDSMNLSFAENTIDLGFLCPDEAKDTTIHVTNYGFIATGAYLTKSQNLSFGKSETTILPSNTENIAFRFNGLNTEGIINEIITLTDSICRYTKTITITGIVQVPKLESTGLVITCVQLTSNDGILTLENKSDRSILIQNAPAITAPFSLVGNPFPLSIPANSSKDITLRFTATDYISHSIPLSFSVEPCGITYETTVIGVVSVPTAVIKIDSLSAYAGEIINIPIILIDGNYLDISGVTTIQTDLVFNPTILTPLNRTDYPVQVIDDKQAKIEIHNIPLLQEIGKTIIEIPFVVGLGNAESCDLVLENSSENGGVTDIKTQSGTFKLLGICHEGGTRLIKSNGKAEILSIIPNPASDIVEIKVYLIEKGVSTIELYNSNGVKLFEEILTAQTGLQTINLDLNNYDSGLYFIKLHTPTVIDTEKLMIVK